ncbi:hypothetical protein B0I37DRAFT_29703 [Chaetomium sp. MPI-CAGE-AT-0009]|nr:hypothetical protein B0I37DRAFT_29703 [Chaetomium sp. MPI-CAGE-AT-0009]
MPSHQCPSWAGVQGATKWGRPAMGLLAKAHRVLDRRPKTRSRFCIGWGGFSTWKVRPPMRETLKELHRSEAGEKAFCQLFLSQTEDARCLSPASTLRGSIAHAFRAVRVLSRPVRLPAHPVSHHFRSGWSCPRKQMTCILKDRAACNPSSPSVTVQCAVGSSPELLPLGTNGIWRANFSSFSSVNNGDAMGPASVRGPTQAGFSTASQIRFSASPHPPPLLFRPRPTSPKPDSVTGKLASQLAAQKTNQGIAVRERDPGVFVGLRCNCDTQRCEAGLESHDRSTSEYGI